MNVERASAVMGILLRRAQEERDTQPEPAGDMATDATVAGDPCV
jgi:hypothetical protein